MEITTRQIEAFRAVADTASFTRAAERAHVTQPALTSRIQALEQALGGPLFVRGRSGTTLTPLGRTVEQHVQAIEDSLAQLRALGRSGGTPAEISIGIIPTIAPYLLPGTLDALRALGSATRLQVHELRSADVLDRIRAGTIDIGVLALPYDTGDDLAVQTLFADPFVLGGAEGDIPHRMVTPDAIDISRLLLLEEGHCLADQTLALCEGARSATRNDVSATNLSTICRLAAAGYGLTLLPAMAVTTEVAQGLAVRPLRGSAMARDICVVHHPVHSGAAWRDTLIAALTQAGQSAVAAGVQAVTTAAG